ncbi:MAG: choice-of-anchor J domain-containing protein [Calditrichaeota bacterium]|nr:choice-of-anchor J domain-containing protein [Calditrichota bacterium]
MFLNGRSDCLNPLRWGLLVVLISAIIPLKAQTEGRRIPSRILRSIASLPAEQVSGDTNNIVKWQEIFNGTTLPAGWEIINADGSLPDTLTPGFFELVQQVDFRFGDSTATVLPDTGQSFLFSNFLNANENGLIDERLVTPVLPTIEAGDSISFYAGAIDQGFDDSLFVFGFDGPVPSADTLLNRDNALAQIRVAGPPGAWHRYAVPLGDFEGRQIRVLVNYRIDNGGRFGRDSDNVWVDHFTLTTDTTFISGINFPAGEVVRSFELLGNFPNPFNPQTEIAFRLQRSAPVALRVFAPNGQLVRTLLQGFRPAGEHRERWDGRNDSGAEVSSGVYFYRLQVGPASATAKMLLIR